MGGFILRFAMDPISLFMTQEAGAQYKANQVQELIIKQLREENVNYLNERDQIQEQLTTKTAQNQDLLTQVLQLEHDLKTAERRLFRSEYAERLYKRQLEDLQKAVGHKVVPPRKLPDGWIKRKRVVMESFDVTEQ